MKTMMILIFVYSHFVFLLCYTQLCTDKPSLFHDETTICNDETKGHKKNGGDLLNTQKYQVFFLKFFYGENVQQSRNSEQIHCI